MLRSIISKTASELPHSNGPGTKSNAAGSELTGKIPGKSLDSLTKGSDDWEDVLTLIVALEKVESWLFSRIVESVWWQVCCNYYCFPFSRIDYIDLTKFALFGVGLYATYAA